MDQRGECFLIVIHAFNLLTFFPIASEILGTDQWDFFDRKRLKVLGLFRQTLLNVRSF